jgi:phage tail sheath protein FI
MAEFLSPWLYTVERKASAGAIAAVSTSTYATVGWLRKGPVDKPQLITSFGKFVEVFGTYWRNSYVPFAVAAFFQNGGARAYISRVVPSDATKSADSTGLDTAVSSATFYTRQLADPLTTLDATHYNIGLAIDGAPAADIDVTGDSGVGASYALSALATTIDGTAGISCVVEAVLGGGDRLKITSDSTGPTSSLVFSAATANDCSKELLGLDTSGGSFTYEGAAAIDWTLTAAWPGAAYDQTRFCISGNPDYQDGDGGYTAFDVEEQEESSAGAADWQTMESYDAVVFDDDTSDQFAPTVINGETDYIKIEEGATFDTPSALKSHQRANECVGEGDAAATTFSGTLLFPAVYEGSLTIVAGAITATDQGDGTLAGTGIVSGTINYTTGAWTLEYSAAPAAAVLLIAAYSTPATSTEVCVQLAGGTDGTGPLARADVSDPALEASKAGIYAFNAVDEILNMSLPDFAGTVTVANDLFSYAENREDIFVIAATALGVDPSDAEKWIRNTAQYNTSYGALYYPWVKIEDPIAADGRGLNIPPDGFIAGVYARTDSNRNVGKSPGGIEDGKILGAIGLERDLDKGERDLLYPARINPLVSTAQTGRAVWGVRTLSYDAEWRYINARRLFIFCKKSVYNASFWTVFENNGAGLWSRMKAQGDGFFLNLFRDNYFAGETPAEAFFIQIDEENNPQEAIDAGLLTADYYIAPNKPAEFVRIRFQQKVKAAE